MAPRHNQDRPNFVLFVTDQHRADYLGCYGHPVLRTPHIDRIPRNGVRFDKFYVSSPQCQANRSTMMTGRMPSVHGVRGAGIPLPLRSNTFVDLMRADGYQTALVGKCHLQNIHDWAPEILPQTFIERRDGPLTEFSEALKPIPGEDYEQERGSLWRYRSVYRPLTDYYGFEHVDLVTQHGDMGEAGYYTWLRSKGYSPEKLRGPDNTLPHDYVCPEAWRTAVPEELYPTAFVEQKSVEYLENYARLRDSKPLFMQVSFPDPHHPFTPPGRYWGMHNPDDMPLPPSFDMEDDPPPHLQWSRKYTRTKGNAYHAYPATRREAQEAAALTCDMMAMVDDAVGTVLDTLDRLGMSDNTILMFTSDHADLLGDHGLVLKGPFHFQGLVRVPFMWSDPHMRPTSESCDRVCGTIDMGPTILNRAGIDPFNGMQGRSMLPLMSEPRANWRHGLVIEEEQQHGVLGFDEPMRLNSFVTERHRMTIYHDVEWGELYDLEEDPHECTNLWDSHNARELRREMMEALAYERMALVDTSPFPTRLA